jgi:AcrR family transcriptional regulator
MASSSARAEREARRRYAGRAPEERRTARRERLVEAAQDLFGTDGYMKTPIEKLCAHAGVATRHFYEEFDSREALLKFTYDRIIGHTRTAVLKALDDAGEDPRRRVFASIDAFLRAYLDDPRRGRIACIEIVGVSAALETHRRDVIVSFAGIIAAESERAARAGLLPKRNFMLSSIAMAGAVNELAIECLIRKPAPAFEAVRDELVALFIARMEGASPSYSVGPLSALGTARANRSAKS